MTFLPREHGAYGQLVFPLATAFAVAGATPSGLLTAAAVVAAFLAHEPLLVVFGLRGARARRETGRRAARWLLWLGAAALTAGVGALVVASPASRWSFALPVAPAAWLAVAAATGREKTWHGEVSAALAFSLTAVPVCVAAGATPRTAVAVAIPFVFLFVSGTLAVRTVIANVRGGGDKRTTALMRWIVVTVAVLGSAALAAAAYFGFLPWAVPVAAAPGLLVAVGVAAILPSPARLRTIGWTLVTVSLVTSAVIVIANMSRAG